MKKTKESFISIVERLEARDKAMTEAGISIGWRRRQVAEKPKKKAKNSDQLMMC